MNSVTPCTRGFTLLEVLIALSIFSLIGLASYRVLDIVILSQSKVTAHQQQMRALERAVHRISADVTQIVNRPIRDNYGDPLPAFDSNGESYLLTFTRQGWRNPLQLPRSQLQRVAYELEQMDRPETTDSGYQLLRHYWPVLDRDQESQPQTQVLLTNLIDAQLLFMDQQGNWHSQWPLAPSLGQTASYDLPAALMVKLLSKPLGQIERIYPLPSFNAKTSKNKSRDAEATRTATEETQS